MDCLSVRAKMAAAESACSHVHAVLLHPLSKCIEALSCSNQHFKSRERLSDSNAAGSAMVEVW
jgi:hypothetical protein